MNDEKYFINDGCLYKAKAEYDELQDNPRTEWDGWYTHMNIYLRDYAFGDNDGGGERETDLIEFVNHHYSNLDLIKMAFDGRFSTKYEYGTDENGERIVKAKRTGEHTLEYELQDYENYIVDDIFEEFTFQELWNLCQNHPDFVALPIYAYIHSGITISTGSFGDPWDSGWAGYIYVTREDAEKNGVEWNKGDMIKLLESEVKLTDQWLTGQVYWIGIEKYDIEDGWDYYDSCGGHFSEKYGDDLCAEMIEYLCGIDVDEFYDEGDKEVQKYYEMTDNLEFAKETDRLNMLDKFGETLRDVFDRYHINANDLRTIKEAMA